MPKIQENTDRRTKGTRLRVQGTRIQITAPLQSPRLTRYSAQKNQGLLKGNQIQKFRTRNTQLATRNILSRVVKQKQDD
jgi:hypothetical protein